MRKLVGDVWMRELSDKERLDFKRKLEGLADHRGRATELISLYVPPNRPISDVAAYLRDEFSQSSNIKSTRTRKNVTGAIESILSRLKGYRMPPENGVVFFVGHVAIGADQTRMVAEVLEPPDPVTTFLYRCDSSFYLEPLQGMLVDKKSYGLIVLDRNEASIGLLKGKQMFVVRSFESGVMGKHRMGGQSAQRYERLIEISAHAYFKRVGDLANEKFLAEKELQGILIGGPGPTKKYFAEQDFLHYELKKKVIDTFDTGYTDEYGLRELVENASQALSGLELMREKGLMNQFMREVKKSVNSLATYGESEVRRALQLGAVDTLLVSEGLRKKVYRLKCNGCGDESVKVTAEDIGKPVCAKCQSQKSVASETDLIDDYYEMAAAVGTKVELISQETSEGEILMKAFGGVGALLRYSLGG